MLAACGCLGVAQLHRLWLSSGSSQTLPMARTWQLRNEDWLLPENGAILGILCVTPDLFPASGQRRLKRALAHAERLIAEGADGIDVAGEATRPGALRATAPVEQRRVLPVIRALREKYPQLRISINTRRASTARAALDCGADIVTDVTGLKNPAMLELFAQERCGIVLMHIMGDPFDNSEIPIYFNPVTEIRDFFATQLAAAQAAGIELARICLDPGIGYRKRCKDNVSLIYSLGELRVHNLPLVMSLSRKRYMKDIMPPVPDTLRLNIPPPPPHSEYDAKPHPTVGLTTMAAGMGADVHRVHDVAAHRAVLRIRYRRDDETTETR